jgi:hypothetical protein
VVIRGGRGQRGAYRIRPRERLPLDNSNAALVHDFTIDNAGGQRFQAQAQPRARANGQFTVPAGR